MMRLTFEATTAREMFRQIADFIEVGAAPNQNKVEKVAFPAQAVAKEAKAQADYTPPSPTPAILAKLGELDIPKSEWPNISRSGAKGRMTQADVVTYASTRVAPAPAEAQEQAAPAPTTAEATDDAPEQVAAGTDGPTASAPAEISDDTLKAKLTEVYSAFGKEGRAKCFAMLARFGVEKGSQLTPEQRVKFVDLADKAVAGAHDPEVSTGD